MKKLMIGALALSGLAMLPVAAHEEHVTESSMQRSCSTTGSSKIESKAEQLVQKANIAAINQLSKQQLAQRKAYLKTRYEELTDELSKLHTNNSRPEVWERLQKELEVVATQLALIDSSKSA